MVSGKHIEHVVQNLPTPAENSFSVREQGPTLLNLWISAPLDFTVEAFPGDENVPSDKEAETLGRKTPE